ncbi:MAG: CHAT domain-containing protein [Candidatus Omnitrophica bacterium]|nr:CHAT domain-containing protein [Candidatus Omnitrophota bacterium]
MDRSIISLLMVGALCTMLYVFPDGAAADRYVEDDIRVLRNVLSEQIEALGPDHLEVGHLYYALARATEENRAIEEALPFYESALTIYYSRLGLDHPRVKETISHVASAYSRTGRSPQGPLEADVSTDNLAGDIAIAQHIYDRQNSALADGHPMVIKLLDRLVRLHSAAADYPQALRLAKILLDAQKKAFPGEHPVMAQTLQMIGRIYRAQGDVQAAADNFSGAFAIWQRTRPGAYRPAVDSLNALAYLYADLKETEKAIQASRVAQNVELRLLQHLLTFSSEQQRLRHLETSQPYALHATLGDTAALALSVLIYKGLVLDSLMEDLRLARSSTDPQHQRLVRKRNLAKERLMQLELTDTGSIDPQAEQRRRQIMNGLQNDIRQAEQQLGYSREKAEGTRRALEIIPADIQRKLDDHTALIEFIRYPHYLGSQMSEERYGALIFTARNGLHWVPLGASSAIDAQIRTYQRLTRGNDTRDTDLRYNLQRLYHLLWLPINKTFTHRIERVIISPTHGLNFISFATLLDPRGNFLNERFSISYVTSGRDLLRAESGVPKKTFTVFADPLFHEDTSRAPFFADLPGTLAEAKTIQQLAQTAGYAVTLYTREQASEENLKQARSPAILHIATHGFFGRQAQWRHVISGSAIPLLKDDQNRTNTLRDGVVPENPMHQSGLALAGADRTIRHWQQGLSEPVRDDGLVTADEVSLLDLHDTWLVFLSACDTGLGDAQTGEGVFGLRRGFLQAGARHLIMSLWNIPDEGHTPKIVRDIYGKILQGESPEKALAETQREWMLSLRKSQGLHAAVKKAGAFIVISQGVENE